VQLRDGDLAKLAALQNLTVLHLENTPITDAGLQHLGKLEKLRYLNLFGTAVTDAGVKELAGLKHLRSLYVAGTKITGQGVRELRQLLPKAIVEAGAEFAEIATDPEPSKKPTAPAPVKTTTEKP